MSRYLQHLREGSTSATRNAVVDTHIPPDDEQKTELAKDALQMKDTNELFFPNTRGAQILVSTGYSWLFSTSDSTLP